VSDEAEVPRRRTGEYLPVHDPTPEHPVTAPELRTLLTWQSLRSAGVALVAVVAGTVTGWQVLTTQARAQAGEVSAEVSRRVQAIEDAGRRHEAESDATHAAIKADMHELQRDIRELYRVVRDPTRRSERLEAALPKDGGP
jgi:hypothetical protein